VTTQTLPKLDRPGPDDDVDHLAFDCHPDIAMCGTDLTGVEFGDTDEIPIEQVCRWCLLELELDGTCKGCRS
jgi:hypothetical protein